VIQDHCDWSCSGQPSPLEDFRQVIITAPEDCQRWIEFEFRFVFREETTILPSNHSLFSAEVIPEMSVRGGNGTILNSEGGTQEEGTFGIPAAWCDYSGIRNGHPEGLTIFQHPENCGYPWPHFTRNYGFFSPTPMYWLAEEGLHYRPGEEVTLRFLVVVHAGMGEVTHLDQIRETWLKRMKRNPNNPVP
jgi:hypothetical protein